MSDTTLVPARHSPRLGQNSSALTSQREAGSRPHEHSAGAVAQEGEHHTAQGDIHALAPDQNPTVPRNKPAPPSVSQQAHPRSLPRQPTRSMSFRRSSTRRSIRRKSSPTAWSPSARFGPLQDRDVVDGFTGGLLQVQAVDVVNPAHDVRNRLADPPIGASAIQA